MLEGSFVPKDQLAHFSVVLMQHSHHFLRFGGFSEGSESPEVQIRRRQDGGERRRSSTATFRSNRQRQLELSGRLPRFENSRSVETLSESRDD
jgi:hypothetical protein